MVKQTSSAGIFEFIKEFYPEYIGIKEYPVAKSVFFHKKTDEHWILSNMVSTPIVVGGVMFKSSEHLFQTMKFATEESVMAVYQSNSPKMTAKHYQKIGGHRRKDWGSMIIDAMKFCLQMKHEQCSAFREDLAGTEGFYIAEKETPRKKEPSGWATYEIGTIFKGPNMMGRLLMELRDKGKLEYKLPKDALEFITIIQNTL